MKKVSAFFFRLFPYSYKYKIKLSIGFMPEHTIIENIQGDKHNKIIPFFSTPYFLERTHLLL